MFGIFWAEYLTGGNLPEIYVAFLFVKKKSGKIKPMSQPKCECCGYTMQCGIFSIILKWSI